MAVIITLRRWLSEQHTYNTIEGKTINHASELESVSLRTVGGGRVSGWTCIHNRSCVTYYVKITTLWTLSSCWSVITANILQAGASSSTLLSKLNKNRIVNVVRVNVQFDNNRQRLKCGKMSRLKNKIDSFT